MTSLLAARDKAVYRWEWECLAPNDRTRTVPVETRGLVPYVWNAMGLLNPPKVEIDPRMNSLEGRGTRLKVVVGEATRLHTILHELAHSMDQSVEVATGLTGMRPDDESGDGSYHDANWLGLYVNLLDRFIGGAAFNKLWLYKTLHDRGLDVSYAPKVRCI